MSSKSETGHGVVRKCPFCLELAKGRQLASNAHAAALRDMAPLAPGHTLVVPLRHAVDIFELPSEELECVWRMIEEVRNGLYADGCRAFNVGTNIGASAGQTVDHAHVHVIPRAAGDVADPSGGIRCVIPTD